MKSPDPGKGGGPVTALWAPLTSFVGRAGEAAKLARLLGERRLVTVTGPGGVGKTRLATEVARRVADQFPDGVYFIGLGAVSDLAGVPEEVAAALGVQQVRGRAPLEVLAEVLAPRRLLLVLDNCEHVLSAVAELCGALLRAADDVHILATSREQLWVGGEARYRLPPLELPATDDPAGIRQSAAVALFTERAREADPHFALDREYVPLVARVVARLDGMPLAIELAAARVEALGMAGLADRLDDALRVLADKGSLVAGRHKSLAAVAEWSYQLLSPPEQRVFRRLAVFPGPFTLEAAEAAGGPAADAVVLRLVDCSLLAPPRPGPDQRVRYTMLQTLRAYALGLLKDAGEEHEAAAALAAFALSVAEQASTGLETLDRELGALRWLDAEDATTSHALSWLLEHDPGSAMRLAAALAPWWWLRGRLAEGYEHLSAALRHAAPDSRDWAKAQVWLGHMSSYSGNYDGGVAHYTAACEAGGNGTPSRAAVDALAIQSIARANLGHAADGAQDARRALALARELGYLAGEVQSLIGLSATAHYAGEIQDALSWGRQAQELITADVPGWVARLSRMILTLELTEAGDLAAARRSCDEGLLRSREAGDLADLANLLAVRAHLEYLAGNLAEAASHLREAVDVASAIGQHMYLRNCVEVCGYLCAATGRHAEALTLWAAHAADVKRTGSPGNSAYDSRRQESLRQIEKALGPAKVREAEDRGAGMAFATAVKFVIMLMAEAQPPEPQPAPRGTELSDRERELVTLVAQGRTNAEIAAQLFISIRTVSSHLDRIRDKTGYRRRADLTRLALREGLV